MPPDTGEKNAMTGNIRSYSERVKSNIKYDQRLKRNVLEITLEKSMEDAHMEVDDIEVARICKTLGIDITSQVEGYNFHYKGRIGLLCIWMSAGINLERFCKDISIRVSDGLVTGMIRPAGKKDVTVTVNGLDFNTPDAFVVDYLNKFGSVTNNSAVYSKYETGPFKGKYNGERKFQVDFSTSKFQMGNYHIIDGNKVRIFYRGNIKTCGRCHKPALECAGGGLAKNCEVAGGDRVTLIDHMKRLWSAIGFTPTSFEADEDDMIKDDEVQAEKDQCIQSSFPSKLLIQPPSESDSDKFNGITVKNFSV